MITGVIKNKVDKIWTDIWAGGITNPLTVIEQLTYLMFVRSLDEKELETEEFEHMTGEKMEKIFPQSAVGQSMRWSKFKNNDPRDIFNVISQRVFPAIKNMKHGRLPDFTEQGELVEIADDSSSDVQNETAFARYMSDAMFLIPTPQVLQKSSQGWMTCMSMTLPIWICRATCTSTCWQTGHRWAERPVSHSQAYPGNDGGVGATHPGRHHLRPGLRHGRLSGLRRGVHSQPLRGYHDFRAVGALCWGRLHRL